MKHHAALIASLVVLLATSASFAEQVGSAQNLIPLQRWVRFEVIMGRLHANSVHLRRPMNLHRNDATSKRKESLSITYPGNICTVQYVASSPQESLRFDYQNTGRFELLFEPQEETAELYLHYYQMPQQPIRLVTGKGTDEKVFSADNLWQLFLAEPELCNQHLMPLLNRLRSDWPLAEQAESVKAELAWLSTQPKQPKKDWRRLINQLGSDRFQQRQLADRQLREEGLELLHYLQQFKMSKLSAEQRYRIKQIKASLTIRRGDDTPQRIARWLQNDPTIWMTLLSDDSLSHRTAAVAQLTHLHGRPINFNPKVSAALRKAEIDRLRRLFAAGN